MRSPLALFLSALLVTASSQSAPIAAGRDQSVKSLFAQVNATAKGALGKNSYQLADRRIQVINMDGVPRGTIFTVAFRNELASQLAAMNFYVGNRFASNYWEMHNKYLATPGEQRALAFHQDPARFLATADMAPDAYLMARHTLLERFYMLKFPDSRLARANNQRGTSDADNEAEFGARFAQYLAKWMSTPSDYIVIFELQRRINRAGSSDLSLQSLRDQVGGIYDQMLAEGTDAAAVAQFYKLRNSIHNYMTPDVLGRIDAFLKTFGGAISGDEVASIKSMRAKIAAYYSIDKKVLVSSTKEAAAVLPQGSLDVVNALADKNNPLVKLEALSWLTVQARASFWASRNPAVIDWIVKANRYLSMELTSKPMKTDDWGPRARIAMDSAYASGLVTTETWTALRASLAMPTTDVAYVKDRYAEISGVLAASQVLVAGALGSALSDWKLVEPTSEGYVDDTLRSSLLTELNQITVVLAKLLPKATGYEILNEGTAYGYLVYLPQGAKPDDVAKLDKTMIPVFAELPIEVGLVAGIITEAPQTPLSHVNIKSKARGTPNVYYPNAFNDPYLKDLIAGRALVKMSVRDGKVEVRAATLDEARAYWRTVKAPVKIDVRSDLSEKRIRSTKELYSRDVIRYGTKASNYGEAERVLPEGVMREGLGIPFYYYNEYLETALYDVQKDSQKTIAQRIREIIADPRTLEDHDYLVQEMSDLQKSMTDDKKEINPAFISELKQRLDVLYPDQPVRFRSSTNSEDLPNFSGAGLYDSFTYDPKDAKKTMQRALKKAWASAWNVRAFDEREHFGINHTAVYMAILTSPSFPAQIANGVAVSRNVPAPKLGDGLFINTQVGENLVTNPDPHSWGEEVVVLKKPDAQAHLPYTFKYLRYSSLSPNVAILTPDEMVTLSNYVVILHKQFKKVFDPANKNPKFAVDIEWKVDDTVDGQRKVYLKQCRPYVE